MFPNGFLIKPMVSQFPNVFGRLQRSPHQDPENLQKHSEIGKPLVLFGNHSETLGNIGKPLVLIRKPLENIGFAWETNSF